MAQEYLTTLCNIAMEKQLGDEVFDDMLYALSNPYQRQLLLALLEHNPQDDNDHDPLNLLSGIEEAEVLQSELVHNHLPKLDDMGYISWNRTTNKISKGPNWDDIAPVLKLMYDNQDDLPDGWL